MRPRSNSFSPHQGFDDMERRIPAAIFRGHPALFYFSDFTSCLNLTSERCSVRFTLSLLQFFNIHSAFHPGCGKFRSRKIFIAFLPDLSGITDRFSTGQKVCFLLPSGRRQKNPPQGVFTLPVTPFPLCECLCLRFSTVLSSQQLILCFSLRRALCFVYLYDNL